MTYEVSITRNGPDDFTGEASVIRSGTVVRRAAFGRHKSKETLMANIHSWLLDVYHDL